MSNKSIKTLQCTFVIIDIIITVFIVFYNVILIIRNKKDLFEILFNFINVFGFFYIFVKLLLGVFISIIIILKLKKLYIKTNIKHQIPYIIFTIVMLLYIIFYLIANAYEYGTKKLIFISLLFIIGTFNWIHLSMFNINKYKLLKIFYCTLSPLCNYLLLIITYLRQGFLIAFDL